MDVGIGDGDDVVGDSNDDDMRIGFADVVLDREALAVARRRGGETRMAEFQLDGGIDAAHEGLDRGRSSDQPMDMSARDHLFGVQGREPVERFVQIHHQPMQAVVFCDPKSR